MPGSPSLLREVYLPVPAILCLQVTPPLTLIAAAQQADNGLPPDFLNGLLFEEKAAPDAVPNVKSTASDGNVEMRVLIQLPTTGVKGAEDTHFDALPARPLKHGPGGTAEQLVEQGPVIAEKGPQQVWHVKGDVLPFAVGEDVQLLSDPLPGGLHAAGTAGL